MNACLQANLFLLASTLDRACNQGTTDRAFYFFESERCLTAEYCRLLPGTGCGMKKRREASWIRFYLGVLTWVLFGCNAGHAASLVWNPNLLKMTSLFTRCISIRCSGSSQVNVTETRFSLNDLPLGVAFTIRVTATASGGLESHRLNTLALFLA